jgi:hypothetical protein
LNRESSGRDNIKTLDRMLELKGNCFPVDYALNMLRRLHNLKQFKMSIKEYTKEFFKLCIRSR